MAREIKAVQCPKCGSTKKVELRKDYFKCLNCDTEYYIENDDVTITHNVNYNNAPLANNTPSKTPSIVVGILLLLFFSGFIISQFFSSKPANQYSTSESPTASKEVFRWSDRDLTTYTDAAGKPVVVIFGQRDYDNDEQAKKSGKYIAFYDPLTEKEVKVERLPNIPTTDRDEVEFMNFSNGEIYAITNDRTIFKLNTSNKALESLNQIMANRYPEFSSGIAKAEFVGDRNGDGFSIMSNEGKHYYYFPINGKVYNDKAYRQAQLDIATKDPNAKTKTYFTFSGVSSDYPDEESKLIRFTQKDNAGGPKDWPWFEVSDHYNYYGKYKSDFRFGEKLVISYKDLTPGRKYFATKILYTDKDFVLLSMSATAAEDANSSVQCLNANTGAIIFTLPFTEKISFDEQTSRYAGGFILKTYNEIYVIGMDGKLIRKFKIS
ncbi:hypothetical protein [Pedobacter duraquae]|nr:hypothetical protein [Pedobacter duraquae]